MHPYRTHIRVSGTAVSRTGGSQERVGARIKNNTNCGFRVYDDDGDDIVIIVVVVVLPLLLLNNIGTQ